jgi:RNA recognition motif-containing protein
VRVASINGSVTLDQQNIIDLRRGWRSSPCASTRAYGVRRIGAQQGADMRKQSFRGNVFVANLPQGFTDQDLAQTFDAFGLVIGALLARDLKTGAAKTHGLVDIAPQKAADAAIAAMNGTVIGGSRIEVRRADPAMSITVPGPAPSRARMERREPRPAARAVVVEHRSLRPRA